MAPARRAGRPLPAPPDHKNTLDSHEPWYEARPAVDRTAAMRVRPSIDRLKQQTDRADFASRVSPTDPQRPRRQAIAVDRTQPVATVVLLGRCVHSVDGGEPRPLFEADLSGSLDENERHRGMGRGSKTLGAVRRGSPPPAFSSGQTPSSNVAWRISSIVAVTNCRPWRVATARAMSSPCWRMVRTSRSASSAVALNLSSCADDLFLHEPYLRASM